MGSPTPNLGLTVPTIGGDAGPVFAQEINNDLLILDAAYGGVNTLSVAGNSNVTATQAQSQNLVQQLTGTLTGNITYFLPAVGASYAIENATNGPFNLSVGCVGGANTLTIPQGLSTWVWTDGSVIRVSNPPGWQEITTVNMNAAVSVAIALPSPFRRFRLTFQSLSTSVSTQIQMQLSINGGSSFISSTSYTYNGILCTAPSTTVAGFNAVNTTSWPVSGAGLVAGSVAAVDASYEIFPGSASVTARFLGQCSNSVANGFQFFDIAGYCSTAGTANAVGVSVSMGTMTGTIIVEGLP